MLLLGIHCTGHDTAAAIVKDGKVLFAIQEERLSGIKHDGSFPHHAIKAALAFSGNSINDLDAICVSLDPDKLIKEKFLRYNLENYPATKQLLKQQLQSTEKYFHLEDSIRNQTGFRGKIWFCDHHLAHMASAYYVSGFEQAAIFSIDGIGEIDCSVTGKGHQGDITVFEEDALRFPHSIGLLYAGITHHLGFLHHCDEGKVMGLASYGSTATFAALEKELIHFEKDGKYVLNTDYLAFHINRELWFSDKMYAVIGPERSKNAPIGQLHMDLAATVQSITEKAFQHTLAHLYRKTETKQLCMAGGVALNCVANGKMLTQTPFENIFIQPAANDPGTAVGAALRYYYKQEPYKTDGKAASAYLGIAYSDKHIEHDLEEKGLAFEYPESLVEALATSLMDKKIIGWFNGRSEFGPRALGNRSILALPYPAEMKDILNLKVKHRESFRPFAPLVRLEDVSTYFETITESPFMLLAANVKKEYRELLPAITHIDGTARVQTVTREQNAPIYDLLTELHRKTGIGVLVNTSFNVMGKPIVELPGDAISCFLSTHMDVLVMNNKFVVRKQEVCIKG